MPLDVSFPRQKRILTAADYSLVFKQRKRFTSEYVTIYVRKNQLHHARLGLAISKKNVRLAVKRNRIKRVIRESFRLTPELSGLDITVVGNKALKNLDLGGKSLKKLLDDKWQYLVKWQKQQPSKV